MSNVNVICLSYVLSIYMGNYDMKVIVIRENNTLYRIHGL